MAKAHGVHVDEDAVFDASLVLADEPLDYDALHAIENCLGKLKSVSEIEVAISHARRELNEHAASANWNVWKRWASEHRAPTIDEATAAIKEHGHMLVPSARRCRQLRVLLERLAQSLDVARQLALDDMHARSRGDDEAELRAAFEAHEASAREERFKAWRARF